ncbi:helix-turn-helix domain-containing protein [Lentibacillus sp. Marseille-P4043]|uniref:helix-turn-helix domain-containing protein n=1 Tax=Lentibacillus sp. Marseille-P4043 TaxID=2040293 RepID=UPI000D0B3898|nr:helix-turn-helix domain-containing protein [Lentibacillus sp. Marseille-P4043]
MNLEQIAYNIKFLREQNEWTQKELAEKLSTSRSVIAKWENNVVTPDVPSLIELSMVFDVTIDHIVGNYTLREDLLKDFKRVYSSKARPFDVEVMELVEYLMMHPLLKEQIYQLKKLPMKKQKSLHLLFATMIEEYERL